MNGNSVKILFTGSTVLKYILLAGLSLNTFLLHSQPMPVELMVGNRFVTIDFNASRKFSQASRFGFFHMNTIQAEYIDKSRDNFTIQDYLFYEVVKNVRIVGGAYYGKGVRLAADINEYGPKPQVEYNLGLFVRKELF